MTYQRERTVMALWKETPTPAPTGTAPTPQPVPDRSFSERAEPRSTAPAVAGRFKGDVRIDGNFTIEPGAHLTGQVLAGVVIVGGELQGNIESAKRVDVLEGGVIVGDVKAGSITVAAGSRMRGHVEFGWDDKAAKPTTGLTTATGTATGVPTAASMAVGKS